MEKYKTPEEGMKRIRLIDTGRRAVYILGFLGALTGVGSTMGYNFGIYNPPKGEIIRSVEEAVEVNNLLVARKKTLESQLTQTPEAIQFEATRANRYEENKNTKELAVLNELQKYVNSYVSEKDSLVKEYNSKKESVRMLAGRVGVTGAITFLLMCIGGNFLNTKRRKLEYEILELAREREKKESLWGRL